MGVYTLRGGTVTNSGTITGTATSGMGVGAESGGTVDNESGGTISGANAGVFIASGAGSVTNAGGIYATTASANAVTLLGGGTVTNTKTISGGGRRLHRWRERGDELGHQLRRDLRHGDERRGRQPRLRRRGDQPERRDDQRRCGRRLHRGRGRLGDQRGQYPRHGAFRQWSRSPGGRDSEQYRDDYWRQSWRLHRRRRRRRDELGRDIGDYAWRRGARRWRYGDEQERRDDQRRELRRLYRRRQCGDELGHQRGGDHRRGDEQLGRHSQLRRRGGQPERRDDQRRCGWGPHHGRDRLGDQREQYPRHGRFGEWSCSPGGRHGEQYGDDQRRLPWRLSSAAAPAQ